MIALWLVFGRGRGAGVLEAREVPVMGRDQRQRSDPEAKISPPSQVKEGRGQPLDPRSSVRELYLQEDC